MRIHSLLDQLWEMDKEKSFARLTITPVREGDETRYHWEDELWIKPYPNPFSYGGYWAMGVAKDKEALEKQIDYFKLSLKRWQHHGLENIEIKEMPEVTITEYEMQLRQRALKSLCEADKNLANQVSQLSLM